MWLIGSVFMLFSVVTGISVAFCLFILLSIDCLSRMVVLFSIFMAPFSALTLSVIVVRFQSHLSIEVRSWFSWSDFICFLSINGGCVLTEDVSGDVGSVDGLSFIIIAGVTGVLLAGVSSVISVLTVEVSGDVDSIQLLVIYCTCWCHWCHVGWFLSVNYDTFFAFVFVCFVCTHIFDICGV